MSGCVALQRFTLLRIPGMKVASALVGRGDMRLKHLSKALQVTNGLV
jgi:hypothetical protein